jgi:hypothetical protein
MGLMGRGNKIIYRILNRKRHFEERDGDEIKI